MADSGTNHRVRFEGPSQRSGPLTMGQANMLRCIARDNPVHINMHVVWDLPPGTDLDRITETLAELHRRHESLRTTYPAGPEPLQLVHADGELAVGVHPAAGDSALFAEELGLRMRAIAFDPAAERPVRAAVVTTGGAPTHLVLALSHAALDASALGLLRREWLALLAGAPLPVPAEVRPLDLAAIERSPEGQRRSASSLDYWAGQLRTVPQAMFAVPTSPAAGSDRSDGSDGSEEGWTPRLRIRSHAAAEALTVLAERTGVTRSTLLLTALCALTTHRTGHRQAVVTTLSANRYLPGLADYMGTVAQDALLTVPVDRSEPGSFEALARRVRKRTQLAYPNSWFDSMELWERIDRTGFERGTRYARDCVFNDLSPLGLDGGVLRGGADPRDPAQQVQLTWLPAEPTGVELMLWAFRLEGELDLSLWTNPSRLGVQEAERLGRGLAALLIEAAHGDFKLSEIEALTGLAPVVRGPRWVVSDGCWIDLDELDRLLTAVLAGLGTAGPVAFRVTAEPDAQLGNRLVCRLATPAPDTGDGTAASTGTGTGTPLGTEDLERIHAACVAGLAGRPAAMAPHLYLVSAGVPADADDWEDLPVVLTGTGRPGGQPTR